MGINMPRVSCRQFEVYVSDDERRQLNPTDRVRQVPECLLQLLTRTSGEHSV